MPELNLRGGVYATGDEFSSSVSILRPMGSYFVRTGSDPDGSSPKD